MLRASKKIALGGILIKRRCAVISLVEGHKALTGISHQVDSSEQAQATPQSQTTSTPLFLFTFKRNHINRVTDLFRGFLKSKKGHKRLWIQRSGVQYNAPYS